MTLALYYHIPLKFKKGKMYLPGYLAVFVDSLAEVVDELILVMHECRPFEEAEADCELKRNNIKWINLGLKTPSWHRAIFHKRILNKVPLQLDGHCDVLIVRSPTPLAPYFKQHLKKTKVVFMIVGDYAEGANHLRINNFRNFAIHHYLKLNDKLFRRQMRTTDVLVNSPGLFRKYELISKSINLIKTTTLSNKDIVLREDTCQNETIQLLYTGRIDPAKGLFELLEACAGLRRRGLPIKLNIVGWEQSPEKLVEKAMLVRAEELGLKNEIFFHGRKQVGPELNFYYQMADVYVIPSYHEGFPRTIWEAMANGLPVIATNVGGIPEYLRHKEDVILIAPKSSVQIEEAILEVINNQNLRRSIIRNARQTVMENTLEIQSSRLLTIIKKLI